MPFFQWEPQSFIGSFSASTGSDIEQGMVSLARPQRGRNLNHGFFSQSYLHPGVLDTQEISSIPNTITSGDLHDGLVLGERTALTRALPPLEDGPPPPGLRGGRRKKHTKKAQCPEMKEKEDTRRHRCRENRPKDSANAEFDPTTGYALDVIPYVKSLPESSIQRKFPFFRRPKNASSTPRHLPDTRDSQGKVGRSPSSASPLNRRDPPIYPLRWNLLKKICPKMLSEFVQSKTAIRLSR
jgi:hypothetical protein